MTAQQTQLNALLAQLQQGKLAALPNRDASTNLMTSQPTLMSSMTNHPSSYPAASSSNNNVSNPLAAASLPPSVIGMIPPNSSTANPQELLMHPLLLNGFSNFIQQYGQNGLAANPNNSSATKTNNAMLPPTGLHHTGPIRDQRLVENELLDINKHIHEVSSHLKSIHTRKTQLENELKQIEMDRLANEANLTNLNGMKQRLESEIHGAGGNLVAVNAKSNMMMNEYDPMKNVRDPRAYAPQTTMPLYNANNNPMMNITPYMQQQQSSSRAVTPPMSGTTPDNIKVINNRICNNYNIGLCDGSCGLIHACSFCKSPGHNFSLCRKPDLCVNFQKNFCVNAKCDRLHVCYMCHSENHGFKDCTRYKEKYGSYPDNRLDSHKWCLYFQATGVCERSTCTVSHKCVNCGGDHPAKDCALNSSRWLAKPTPIFAGSSKDDHHSDKRDRANRDRGRGDDDRDRDYRDSRDASGRDSNDRWLHDKHDDASGGKRRMESDMEDEIRRKRLHIPTIPCTLWNDNDGGCRFGDKCWFKHVCENCESPDHWRSTCPNPKTVRVQQQQ